LSIRRLSNTERTYIKISNTYSVQEPPVLTFWNADTVFITCRIMETWYI